MIRTSDLGNTGIKHSLLLHSCCAPCSSSVLERLADTFDVTVYYYNPNIYPYAEFEKRAQEQRCFLERYRLNSNIGYIQPTYDSNEFFNATAGLENEPEGGARCIKCYRLRLEATAKYAAENGFYCFTTTLSVSPHKNAAALNDIGQLLEKEYNLIYVYSDFKKQDGFKRSIELSLEYGLYRQNYCGCIYSKR